MLTDSSSLMVCVRVRGSTHVAEDCRADFTLWTSAQLLNDAKPATTNAAPRAVPHAGSHAGSHAADSLPVGSGSHAADSLLVDVSHLPSGSTILAIRYGWPLSRGADTCCPSKSVLAGLEPCVPASCPILTATSALPANPFYATLEGGKCRCLAPQVCSQEAI